MIFLIAISLMILLAITIVVVPMMKPGIKLKQMLIYALPIVISFFSILVYQKIGSPNSTEVVAMPPQMQNQMVGNAPEASVPENHPGKNAGNMDLNKLAEGLAKDYTVLNIFRLVLRDRDEIDKANYETIYDLFKLEQIGLYRNNVYSIREFAHIFYMVAFELFDAEKVKIVLEYNTYGSEFLAHLHMYLIMTTIISVRFFLDISTEIRIINLELKKNIESGLG